MRSNTQIFYTVQVKRGERMIDYCAERYPSQADARVAARRLGEYAEIRRVKVTTSSSMIERVEA